MNSGIKFFPALKSVVFASRAPTYFDTGERWCSRRESLHQRTPYYGSPTSKAMNELGLVEAGLEC